MPPPPPPGPPPPPLPNLKLSGGDGGRNELLASIRVGTTLKKTQTNDRSGPAIDSKKSLNTSSSNGNVSALHNGNGTAKFPAGPVGLGGIGGLMAGGIPKLRPTGRGRAMSSLQSESPQVGIRAPMAPQPEASAPPTRRPSAPPQPPPASNKPTMNGNYTRTEPSPNPPIPNKPNPAFGQRKPNLAPRPPVVPPSPTSPVGRPNPPSQSSKPSIPPKSPSMSSSQSNFSLPSPQPPLPNGRPPSVARSQSVRVGMKPAPAPPLPPGPPNLGHSLIGQVSSSSETSLIKTSPGPLGENAGPYPRPHPPREGHATLPRVPPPTPGGKCPSGAISSRPNERPPPPPPLRQIPPHPGIAPPPPPNVAPPQPPQFPAAAQPRHRTTPAPPPPMSLPLMDGACNGPPIVPPRDSSLRKQSIILDEIERRFGTMFRPLSQLTAPEPFTGVMKTYPSQIATMNQSQRRAQAPQPPNLTHLQIGNKMWATNASDC